MNRNEATDQGSTASKRLSKWSDLVTKTEDKLRILLICVGYGIIFHTFWNSSNWKEALYNIFLFKKE